LLRLFRGSGPVDFDGATGGFADEPDALRKSLNFCVGLALG
jgi:hypothetical protein